MEVIAKEGSKQGGGPWAESAAGSQAGLAALMDELSHGVVLVHPDGRLVHANQAARHELVRGFALGLWQGGLVQACRPECDRELQAALARAAIGRRSFVHLDAMEGPGLDVAIVPVKSPVGEPARCALVFSRGAFCDSLMLGFFARRHGITQAEQQVLAGLCDGLSAPQIATRLNVAVSTVRSHVRSICAKARASGVRELVRRIGLLPPVAPAFPHDAAH